MAQMMLVVRDDVSGYYPDSNELFENVDGI